VNKTNVGVSKKARYTMAVSLVLGIAAAMLVGSPSANAKGGDEVPVCHMPGTPAEKVLMLPSSAVEGHLDHGDYLLGGGGGSSSAAGGDSCY